jgi:hypothetical protein
VRILLEKVMLDLPDVVDAEPIGELNLVERLLVETQLGLLTSRLRQLMLVEQSEFHRTVSVPSPSVTLAHTRRSRAAA